MVKLPATFAVSCGFDAAAELGGFFLKGLGVLRPSRNRCYLIKTCVVRSFAAALLCVHQAGWAVALPELIEGVLSTHPTLRSQSALGAAAQQAVEAAQWQFYPTPSVAFEQVNTNSPNDLSYPTTGDKNTTTLRLQQPLWTGGRLTAGVNKAQAAEQVSKANVEVTRQDLALRVVQLYADWYGAWLKRQASEKSSSALDTLQAQIVRRISGGASPPSDLTLLLGRAQQTDAELAAAVAQEHTALARLSQLFGRPVQAAALAASLSRPQPLAADVSALLAQAQSNSPGIVKLQAQVRVAEEELVERNADLYPEAYLRAERQYGNYSVAGTSPLNRIFVGFSSRFGAGLSSFSQVGAAQARLDAAMADVDATRLTIGEQVQADYAQAAAGGKRLQSLAASLESSEKIRQAWSRQFIAGRKTWLDLMNGVRELAQLEVQLADAQSAQLLLSWRLAIYGLGLDMALGQASKQPSAGNVPAADSAWTDATEELASAEPESGSSNLVLRMALELSRVRPDSPVGTAKTSINQHSEGLW
jgi:adhesin transport system outer membrane protein